MGQGGRGGRHQSGLISRFEHFREAPHETSPPKTIGSAHRRSPGRLPHRYGPKLSGRPVRVIVPFAAGGPTDIFARLIAQKLSERLRKQFYVENIAGASGNIGTGQAVRAASDGNTLLFAYSSYVVNPSLFVRIQYDPYTDFDPVTLAVSSTTVLVVNPSVPAKTVMGLVALLRANPGNSYAHGGVGTATGYYRAAQSGDRR